MIAFAFVSHAAAGGGSLPRPTGAADLVRQAKLIRIDGAAVGDNAGVSVAGAGDVNGDGRADVIVGGHFAASNGRANSGSAYVVFGRAASGTVDLATLGQSGFRIDGAAAGDFAGWSVAGAGDLNGDGQADVVVGSRGADNNGRVDSGSAYVVFGKATATTVDLAALGQGGFRIDGAAAGEETGGSVAGWGDLNSDGRADVLVGARFAGNNSREYSGSAYIVFGKAAPASVDLAALGQGGFRIDGAAAGDFAGGSVAGAGHLNGDGRADVLVGARGADNNGRAGSGSAYVVFGKAAPVTVDLAALGRGGFRIDGAAASDRSGYALAGAGDPNGDGRTDLLIGAHYARNNARKNSGSAYVVFGKAAPSTLDLAALGQGGFRIDGAAAGDGAGWSVAGTGDVNGDGRADVLAGAPDADNNARKDSGSAYVVFGRAAPGTVDLDTTAPTLTLAVHSPQRALRHKSVIVHASCDEACRLSASGAIAIVGQRANLRLRPASARLSRPGRRTLRLALSAAGRRRLAGLLGRGRRVRASVTVRARDQAGNASTAKRTAAVRR